MPVIESIHHSSWQSQLGKADQAVEEAQKQFPDSLSVLAAVQVDIEDDHSISQLFEHVTDRYGRLDILIYNAGKRYQEFPRRY